MDQLTEREIYQYSIDELICPYCGQELKEIDGKLYCENCGMREV